MLKRMFEPAHYTFSYSPYLVCTGLTNRLFKRVTANIIIINTITIVLKKQNKVSTIFFGYNKVSTINIHYIYY